MRTGRTFDTGQTLNNKAGTLATKGTTTWCTARMACSVITVSLLLFLPVWAQVSAGSWEERQSLPVASGELIGATINGQPVITGGLGPGWEVSSRVYLYDPLKDAWESLPDLPIPLNHHAASVVDDVLYVMGGATEIVQGMTARAEVYALPLGAVEWETRAPMPEPRWGHAATTLDGRIYVVGGGQPDNAALLIYNPAEDQWETTSNVPTVRDHLSVVAADSLLYTIGGRVQGTNVGTVEVYDPQARSWTSADPLPTPRSGMAVALVNGYIHTTGGEDLQAGTVFDTHEAYSLAEQEWVTMSPLPHVTHGAAGFTLNDNFMVVGGSSRAGGESAMEWLDRVHAYRTEPR